MTSRRNVYVFSGYLLALASVAPFASLEGCGGDDSGAAADAGTDSPYETPQDSGSHPDSSKADSGGSSTLDSGGNNGSDGSVDSGPSQEGDAGGGDTGAQSTDAGGDTGTTQGGGDAGNEDSGSDAGGGSGDGGANGDASVPSGAIAIWHFDEGSGSSAFDSSGNSHTATLMNGATFSTGKHGTGLSPNASGWAVVPSTLPVVPDSGADDAGGAADTGTVADAGGADGAADASDDGGTVDASASDTGTSDGATSEDGGATDDAGDASTVSPFVPLVFDTTQSFSIGCWVKVYSEGPGQWQTAFSKSGGNLAVFTLKLRGDNLANGATNEDFDFDFPGADDTGTGIYTVAQSLTSPTVSTSNGSASYWYHLVGVLDVNTANVGASVVSIYVNGVREAFTSPGTAAILAGAGDTIIGGSLFGALGNSWNGVIDEVYLYDRALSATDVAALYTATK